MKGNHVTQTFGREIREGHLGGCVVDGDPATYYPHMWEHLVEKYKINSVIDIGCGCGHHAKYFQSLGCDIIAVDGSVDTKKNSVVPDHQIVHDYESGSVYNTHDIEFQGRNGSNIQIDLAWCCEFVEHVYEKYSQNFIDDFKMCKYVAMTHAVPGQGGYHHVNEQPKEYWIDVLGKNGFTYLEDDLIVLKEKCKIDWEFMTTNKVYDNVVTSWDQTPLINYRSYFIDTGLFFVNNDRT